MIARDLVALEPAATGDTLKLHLEPGTDQAPPTAVAQLGGTTYRLNVEANGNWALATLPQQQPAEAARTSSSLAGVRLTNVAPSVGLDFRQGAFRFGVSNEYTAMMGGGVCWLDYNGDGWRTCSSSTRTRAPTPTSGRAWRAPHLRALREPPRHVHERDGKAHAGLQFRATAVSPPT